MLSIVGNFGMVCSMVGLSITDSRSVFAVKALSGMVSPPWRAPSWGFRALLYELRHRIHCRDTFGNGLSTMACSLVGLSGSIFFSA